MLTRSRYFLPAVEAAKPLPPTAKPKKSKAKHLAVSLAEEADVPEAKAVREESKWEPRNWQLLLSNIRAMRAAGGAPVDTVGCEKSFDPEADPKVRRFQVLVSLMLSSQTKDEVNHAACERFRVAGLVSPEKILALDSAELGELIKPVGFWRKKVVYLKKTSEILIRDYGGDIPDTVDGLCSLPGVGPKMSHLVMQIAWDKVTGIAVDTHVHRICHRLKFVRKETKDPNQTEQQLEDWVPRPLWTDLNWLLVGFGQTICTPISPKCNQCLNREICPSSNVSSSKKRTKRPHE